MIASRLENEGVVVASNDRTGGKEKTVRLVDQGLMSGKSVVVDNTHVDKEARKPFMDLAKKHNVPVRCFLMTTAHDHARYEFYWDKVTLTMSILCILFWHFGCDCLFGKFSCLFGKRGAAKSSPIFQTRTKGRQWSLEKEKCRNSPRF